MLFENNLKYYRDKARMSQPAVAKAAKISLRSYQDYEYGIKAPGVYAAAKIARALGYSVEEIFPLPLDDLNS